MSARVINAKNLGIDATMLILDTVYVGRGSKWGNPFRIGKDGTREEVISEYREYALDRGLNLQAQEELRGKNLVCWCAPLACHADLLLKWANAGRAE